MIVIAVLCGVIALLVITSLLIDFIQSKKSTEDEIDYNFYSADYEENIYEDEKYLELISGEFIRYCDSTTNLTLGIDRETAAGQGSAVEFLVDMIYDIIEGDATGYNKKFSKKYYENNSPKDAFTMQKVYDVIITFISTEKGDDYTKYLYCVEYKIYHNNGTFRRDIGDGSKKQYIMLTDTSGEVLIDSISTAKVTVK